MLLAEFQQKKIKINNQSWEYSSHDLKAAFDAVDECDMRQRLLQNVVPEKYINLLQFLYSNSRRCCDWAIDFPGLELLPGEWLTDLQYADDVVLLSDDAAKLERLLDR